MCAGKDNVRFEFSFETLHMIGDVIVKQMTPEGVQFD